MDSPGKNKRVSCHCPLQGIVLTQGSNLYLLHLLHWFADSSPLAPPGKPTIREIQIKNTRRYHHFPNSSIGKESAAMQETPIRFLSWEDLLEKG